jgi:signal transduction histidine kinase
MVADLETSRRAVEEKEAARTRLLEQLIQAQEEERKLIARDLHDGVGQSMASLILGIRVLRDAKNPGLIEDKGEDLRRQANDILAQVRLMSRQIHPAMLDDLGLAPALNRYAAEFAEQFPDLTVDLHCIMNDRLPQAVEISLYRLIQEAMTNAARHSGGRTISVVVQSTPQRVQVIIEDDGHGFDAVAARREGRSVGLHSMSERAELLGGKLEIESSSEGTTLFVEAPLS